MQGSRTYSHKRQAEPTDRAQRETQQHAPECTARGHTRSPKSKPTARAHNQSRPQPEPTARYHSQSPQPEPTAGRAHGQSPQSEPTARRRSQLPQPDATARGPCQPPPLEQNARTYSKNPEYLTGIRKPSRKMEPNDGKFCNLTPTEIDLDR